MVQQTQSYLRSLYRRLLRELPANPNAIASRTQHHKLSTPSSLQKRIRDTITNGTPASLSSSSTASQIAQAEQFTQYVEAQRQYLMLIERYNPGMGMSEEERVRLSARKVGMDLPVEFVKGMK